MIKWCKKVPQELISRLYNQSVSGICDDELADEAGCALYARCESIVSVTNAYEKEILICPDCRAEIRLCDDIFNCPCGFRATWEEFRASYKNKQLYAANALNIFTDYLRDFPKAKTYGEKLICIDILIHSFHIKNSYHKTLENYDPGNKNTEINRPVGANLIEGTLSEVILFLDKLSGIDEYSQEKQKWRSIIERANGGGILSATNGQTHE